MVSKIITNFAPAKREMMKHLVILADGSAGWPIAELGDKTVWQAARTPNTDKLVAQGRCGLVKTVQEGFHPGSEVANSTILGYDQNIVFQGRGVLEAASIGYEMEPGDMAMRCNLICIEDGKIKNHSAGHISSEEAKELIEWLDEQLRATGSELQVKFINGIQYRHLLVVNGGSAALQCTPPHDVPGQAWEPLVIKAKEPAAEPTAELLNSLIIKSQELLPQHPINIRRAAEGKDQANSIWPWSPGYKPEMSPLSETYPEIKSGAVITAVDLIKGIGHYAGLRVIEVEGATGLFDTNYVGKAQAAIEALRTDAFVYLHIEAPDEAGHEGNVALKIRTLEDIDRLVVGPILEQVGDDVAIALLPDHPTPCALRTHTNEPVPFVIYKPGETADEVKAFDEDSCKSGSYGLIEGLEFMNKFMEN